MGKRASERGHSLDYVSRQAAPHESLKPDGIKTAH